ncbi:hypothetical protein BREVNS_0662 [Brevinematales bacterium NS]|nr:hypothetical protein BREVNS_0662 [Brevinematales bacterium NS]
MQVFPKPSKKDVSFHKENRIPMFTFHKKRPLHECAKVPKK